jgi:hypothetical protein
MMNKLKFYFFCYFIFLLSGAFMNAYSDSDIIISGTVAKYVSVASSEFEKKLNVKWQNYSVSINEHEDIVSISFFSKDMVAGQRGSTEGVPGFEIKIRKADLKVLESQFIR